MFIAFLSFLNMYFEPELDRLDLDLEAGAKILSNPRQSLCEQKFFRILSSCWTVHRSNSSGYYNTSLCVISSVLDQVHGECSCLINSFQQTHHAPVYWCTRDETRQKRAVSERFDFVAKAFKLFTLIIVTFCYILVPLEREQSSASSAARQSTLKV